MKEEGAEQSRVLYLLRRIFMTLFELKKELIAIIKVLDRRSGHSVDQAQRMLSNLENSVEKEAKRREEFEREVVRRI